MLRRHPFIRFTSVAALSLSLSLFFAPLALAHAVLVRSDPPPNAVLAASPLEIHLWLSEPLIAGISVITVLDSQGRAVQPGEARLVSADATELAVALPPLPNGTYLVNWRAFSAVDGHTTEGAFAFSVGTSPVETPRRGVSTNAPSVSSWAVIWRWLSLLAQAALVGAIAFRWWVWKPASGKSQNPNPNYQLPITILDSRVLFYLCLTVAAVAGTGLFLTQILGATGASAAELIAGRVPLGAIFASRLGWAWIGRMATLIALAVIAGDVAQSLTPASPPAPSPDRICSRSGEGGQGLWQKIIHPASLFLSAQLLFITALGSHSAAIAGSAWLSLPVLADWAHLVGTAIWAGGLLQFAFAVPWVLRRIADADDRAALTRRLVLNFSTVAAFGVALMLLSGVYLASLHVAKWEHLLDTDYGRALLLKIALVVPMLLLGAANLLWMKPKWDADREARGYKLISAEYQRSHLPLRAVQGSAFTPALAGGARVSVPLPHARFWRLVTLEALTGIFVLAASGLLTELPRGADAAALGPGQLKMTTRAGDLRVTLSLSPARLGANQFGVTLADAAGRPLSSPAVVSLRFVSQDRPLGSREVLLDPAGDGSYTVADSALSLAGTWQIEVAARRAGAYDAFAPFDVFVGTEGRITAGRGGASDAGKIFLAFSGLIAGFALIAGATGWVLIAGRAAGSRWAYYALIVPSIIAALVGANLLRRFFFETTPGALLVNPYPPDSASLATGQAIYEDQCAECHGPTGKGDGPKTAGLAPRPPQDFRLSRAARASDGDLFWWIKYGVAATDMPAYRAALTDEEIWHIVNYLRSLGAGVSVAEGVAGVPTNAPTPTPPGGPLPAPGQSDEKALTLLDQVEAAMYSLKYLRETQIVRDDTGRSVTYTYEYAAPDRAVLSSSTGQEMIAIGTIQYYRTAGGAWQSADRGEPFAFPPAHGYTQSAVGARYEGAGTLDSRPVEIVSFADSSAPVAYRLWVDAATKRILQMVMEAPNHHMLSRYDQFDVPVTVDAPEGQ